MKPTTCDAIRPTTSANKTANKNAENQQRGDERRAFGGDHVLQDHVGDAARVIRTAADRRSEDGWRENADAIGSQILQEPGDGGEERGAPVLAIEQGRKAVTGLGCLFGPWRRELDF